MTLDELENSLPNGLHDAIITAFSVDYVAPKLVLNLEVGISEYERPSGGWGYMYRRGTLSLLGLLGFAFDNFKNPQPFLPGSATSISTGTLDQLGDRASFIPATLPAGAFSGYFFLQEHETTILFAAMDARLEWDQGPAGAPEGRPYKELGPIHRDIE
jgi:hypothetical protein